MFCHCYCFHFKLDKQAIPPFQPLSNSIRQQTERHSDLLPPPSHRYKWTEQHSISVALAILWLKNYHLLWSKKGFKISTWETWTPDDNSNEHIRHHHQHRHFNASDWVVCGESVKTRRISGRREMLLASSKKNLNFKPKGFEQTTFQSWWNLQVYCWKSKHRELFYILHWRTHNALYNVWPRLQDTNHKILITCQKSVVPM